MRWASGSRSAAEAVAAWRAEQAEAAATGAVKIQGASLCNGCSSKCGLVATTLGGQLFTLRGSDVHPYAKGTICGRGHGVAQIAYSDLNPGIAIRGPLQQCQKFFTESAKVVQFHIAYLLTSGDQVIHVLT